MQYGIGYTFNLRSFQNRSDPVFYVNKTSIFFHAKYVKGFNQSIDAINSDVSYKYILEIARRIVHYDKCGKCEIFKCTQYAHEA